MKASTTERFDCVHCLPIFMLGTSRSLSYSIVETEFEVIFEPKAVDNPKEVKGVKTANVSYCPFCGNNLDPELPDDKE